jgi:hypothetical protein
MTREALILVVGRQSGSSETGEKSQRNVVEETGGSEVAEIETKRGAEGLSVNTML